MSRTRRCCPTRVLQFVLSVLLWTLCLELNFVSTAPRKWTPPIDVRPCLQFHAMLEATAREKIQKDAGRRSDDEEPPAVHKQRLAAKVVQAIFAATGEDGTTTVASFNLQIAAVVWEFDLPPHFAQVATYGTPTESFFGKRGTGASYGVLDFSFASTGPMADEVPGLGSPIRNGGSVFAHAATADGVEMACMVFYLRQGDSPPNLETYHASFKSAIADCFDGEKRVTGIDHKKLEEPINLSRLAECVYSLSRAHLKSFPLLRGVAAVAAQSLLPPQSESQPFQHPNFGICAPKGLFLEEHVDFAVPYKGPLVFGVEMGTVYVSVYFFSAVPQV